MDIINRIASEAEWKAFFDHKVEQGNLSAAESKDLHSFITEKEYLPVAELIRRGGTFSPPRRTLISKSGKSRKRAVYTYSREENYVLKLMAFMLRDMDHIFSPNLYSFRKERGVKRAVDELTAVRDLDDQYVYKADISDYFNSVSTELLLPKLERALGDQPALYEFLRSLLECPFVQSEGRLIEEQKGIMAGVPVSGFLANLYLRDMDIRFCERNILYMRYSDDIIVFAKSEVELNDCIAEIKSTLEEHRLKINHSKESITLPGQPWTFLGFSYEAGVIDICPVSFDKLKAKMRRKTRALARWASRKQVPGERAARAFIKRFNAKLYDNPVHSELTWARWFFPVINTDRTLKKIDAYMQDCIRYLAAGTRTKSRYNFRYEYIKALGYRSLVNEYYKVKSR